MQAKGKSYIKHETKNYSIHILKWLYCKSSLILISSFIGLGHPTTAVWIWVHF